jgi:predicted nucleic acid binding AN1-type Zn finger protein
MLSGDCFELHESEALYLLEQALEKDEGIIFLKNICDKDSRQSFKDIKKNQYMASSGQKESRTVNNSTKPIVDSKNGIFSHRRTILLPEGNLPPINAIHRPASAICIMKEAITRQSSLTFPRSRPATCHIDEKILSLNNQTAFLDKKMSTTSSKSSLFSLNSYDSLLILPELVEKQLKLTYGFHDKSHYCQPNPPLSKPPILDSYSYDSSKFDMRTSMPAFEPSKHLDFSSSIKLLCEKCNKRLRITTCYTCKCRGSFCATHRYSDRHDCNFDYKGQFKTDSAKRKLKTNAHKLFS